MSNRYPTVTGLLMGLPLRRFMGLGYPYPRVFKRLISLAPKPSFFGTMGPGIYHRPSLHPTRDTPLPSPTPGPNSFEMMELGTHPPQSLPQHQGDPVGSVVCMPSPPPQHTTWRLEDLLRVIRTRFTPEFSLTLARWTSLRYKPDP
jgi:hypothetical protein